MSSFASPFLLLLLFIFPPFFSIFQSPKQPGSPGSFLWFLLVLVASFALLIQSYPAQHRRSLQGLIQVCLQTCSQSLLSQRFVSRLLPPRNPSQSPSLLSRTAILPPPSLTPTATVSVPCSCLRHPQCLPVSLGSSRHCVPAMLPLQAKVWRERGLRSCSERPGRGTPH